MYGRWNVFDGSERVIAVVRWYLRFGLSYRDVEELLAERGIEVDHVTVFRWVQRFTPQLAEAARPCRHVIGDRWQVDETYRTIIAGHAFVQNVRRGHYELAVEAPTSRQVALAFGELALAI
jgi:transposase-like protein